jgi:hypothetical protein
MPFSYKSTNSFFLQNEWDKYFPVETNTGDLNIPDFNFSDFTGGGGGPPSFDASTANTAAANPNANYAYPQSQSQQDNNNNNNNNTTQQQQQQPSDLSDVSFGAMSFFPTPSFYADPHPDRLPARNPR